MNTDAMPFSHEIVALHFGYEYPGSQFYPSCFQITVTVHDDPHSHNAPCADHNPVQGSGNATGPAEKVSFPGAYNENTPGVVFDMYVPPLRHVLVPAS